jgi:hypothetical protein
MYSRQDSGNGKPVTITLRIGDKTAVCGVFVGKFINCSIKMSLLLRIYIRKRIPGAMLKSEVRIEWVLQLPLANILQTG